MYVHACMSQDSWSLRSYLRKYIWIHTKIINLQAYIHACLHTYIHTYYMYVCTTYTNKFTCIHIYMYTCIRQDINTYLYVIHTYGKIYIHIDMYTYILWDLQFSCSKFLRAKTHIDWNIFTLPIHAYIYAFIHMYMYIYICIDKYGKTYDRCCWNFCSLTILHI